MRSDMRRSLAIALGLATLAGPAFAAPTLILRHAAMSIVVEPENRADIAVEVWRPNQSLPLDVRQVGEAVIIDGHLDGFLTSCHGSGDNLHALVLWRGDYSVQQMPQVIVRAPLNAVIQSGAIVRGFVTRSQNLTLNASGCGDWTVANVAGQLKVGVSGVGDIRTGSAQSADLGVSGTGDLVVGTVQTEVVAHLSGAGSLTVRQAGSADLTLSGTGGMTMGPIAGGLTTRLSGTGGLKVDSVAGPVSVDVSGAGSVKIAGGHASRVDANVSGVGRISFGGVADALDANVSGVGGVNVARVTGNVTQHVSGVGRVQVGGP